MVKVARLTVERGLGFEEVHLMPPRGKSKHNTGEYDLL